MSKLTEGLVQVYTGDGKGKSTAAWGQALRAVGQGLQVCFVMFMKGDTDVGEVHAAARLAPQLIVRQFGASREELAVRSGGPWWEAGFTDDDRRVAHEGLEFARSMLVGGDYDVMVLDEVIVAIRAGLLKVEELLALVRDRPGHVELILTGRGAPAEIIAAADLVTEMRLLKHPFQKGIAARRGIEY